MEQIRVIKEMRDESRRTNARTIGYVQPRYMVWENVTGAYSSGHPKGADFQAVLQEICKIVCKDCPPIPIPKEGWHYAGSIDGVGDDGTPFSISWRTHDAQYWGKTIRDSDTGDVIALGTPQRRRRISVVADFGGLSAPSLQFECESECRNIEESRSERERVTGTAQDDIGETGKGALSFQERAGKNGGVKESSFKKNEQELYQPLTTNPSLLKSDCIAYATQACGDRNNPSQSVLEEKAYTLPANPMSDRGQSICYGVDMCGGKGVAYYDVNKSPTHGADEHSNVVCYGISPYDSNAMKSNNPNSGIYEADTSRTLDLNGGNPACNQGGMLVVNSHDLTVNEDRTNALLHGKNDNHDIPCVLGIDRASFNQGKNAKYDISIQEEIAQPLVARGPGGG